MKRLIPGSIAFAIVLSMMLFCQRASADIACCSEASETQACCEEAGGAEHPEHAHAHLASHDHTHYAAPSLGAAIEKPPAPPRWDPEVVALFRSLPVQDGGRVKPLDTLARFTLLQLSGRTTATNADGERISAMEWLLDSLFYPEYAQHAKVFLIQSPEVMDTLGIEHETMRERFSYADIRPSRATLVRLAQQAAHLERNERTRVQEQLIHLAHNVHEFELLVEYLAFARRDYSIGESGIISSVFDGAQTISFSEAVARGPETMEALIALRHTGDDAPHAGTRQAEMDRAASYFRQLEAVSDTAHSLALFPPTASPEVDAEWLAPGDLLLNFFHARDDHEAHTGLLVELEAMERTKGEDAFATHLGNFHDGVVAIASARGEYRAVPLEVSYYRMGLLNYSLALYVAAFILAAFTWLRPHSRLLWWAAFVTTSVPLALHVGAIVVRCVIRLRPPVTTLYETFLFTFGMAVLCALVIEFMNRRRIAVGVASFLGALGLFLANRYEVHEGVDTMPSLIAVLDTNFWLSIHVTTMIIGYAGTVLAAACAHVYLFGKFFGIAKDNKESYKSIARMTYGVVCFALLFNIVGTVLGGIWAADSWGRFWGWDPKENGALLIVLWQLMILHGRMGGYIRDYGVQMAAVFGGIVVAFAWFGVNLLGVGLHSYGFTDGVHGALMSYYTFEAGVLFLGAIGWMRLQGMLRMPTKGTT